MFKKNNLLFLFLFSFVFNFSEGKNAIAIPVDSSEITVRKPSLEKQNEVFSDSDYLFDKQGKPPVSWWDRFWDWLDRQIDDLFSTRSGVTFLFVFKWMLIVAALGLIIFLLLKNDIRFLFYRKGKDSAIGFSEITEDINKIDFDKMIEEAISKKNFKRAVRLYFLQTLKMLSDKKFIEWKPEKTNYDFYLELKEGKIQEGFRSVSILYDYVWYGDFPLKENEFKTAVQQFRKFDEHIKN